MEKVRRRWGRRSSRLDRRHVESDAWSLPSCSLWLCDFCLIRSRSQANPFFYTRLSAASLSAPQIIRHALIEL
ncbi:hypothetical protein BDW74DRAFT_144185 [Aspergillus multicolor]|uniref:uncharacterized protein n=1 Tax=Aspergillus multicolor TaxID=41759 RepID=UPI003CCCA61C